MRVIVIAGKINKQKIRLVVELLDEKVIEEVKKLIGSWRYSRAISTIMGKGKFIKELAQHDIASETSDLILTDTNAYWNLL